MNYNQTMKWNKTHRKGNRLTMGFHSLASKPSKVYWCEEMCCGCDTLKLCNAESDLCVECIAKEKQNGK